MSNGNQNQGHAWWLTWNRCSWQTDRDIQTDVAMALMMWEIIYSLKDRYRVPAYQMGSTPGAQRFKIIHYYWYWFCPLQNRYKYNNVARKKPRSPEVILFVSVWDKRFVMILVYTFFFHLKKCQKIEKIAYFVTIWIPRISFFFGKKVSFFYFFR